MFHLHVGTGTLEEIFQVGQINQTLKSIANYVHSEIAPKSVFEDLLVKTVNKQDGSPVTPCWYLQWLMGTKRDRVAAKNGHHSKKAKKIESDLTLQNIAKKHESIHVQIVFNETKFEEWEEQQKKEQEIPMATIVGWKEDSKGLRIEIDYPKKVLYQACYKLYETITGREIATRATTATTGVVANNDDEWNEVEDSNNEILLSNVWQFKDYTFEIAMKNKYSNVYGKSQCQSGLKITSHKIMFDDGGLDDAVLDAREEFERFDHEFLYKWCKTQLTSSDVFDDLRQMKYGQITTDWILLMIEEMDKLNGEMLLWDEKDKSNKKILDNLVELPKGKEYIKKNKTDKNKDAFSLHLCRSILSRLRILAFKQKTKLGYVPSNNYVIYFWCFFEAKPISRVYIRCCEVESSLALFFSLVFLIFFDVSFLAFSSKIFTVCGHFGNEITKITKITTQQNRYAECCTLHTIS